MVAILIIVDKNLKNASKPTHNTAKQKSENCCNVDDFPHLICQIKIPMPETYLKPSRTYMLK